MIQIRLAGLLDIDSIVKISNEEYPSCVDKYKANFLEEIALNEVSDSIQFIFVAVLNDIIIGHGKLLYYEQEKLKVTFKAPSGWYLNGSIVDEKFRRMGVGSALLDFRVKFSQQRYNYPHVYSIVSDQNSISINYHLKNSFRECRRARGFLMSDFKENQGILFIKKMD